MEEQVQDSTLSDRSGSPAPSLYSFSSSVDGRHVLRNLYGRILNNQNDTYLLPADHEEHRRLDLQHHIYTLSLGALYPAAPLVQHALRPQTDKKPAILDVGSGSGSWAIDMAKEFPHCDIVGVDLVPPKLEGVTEVPSNCRFEIDDANLGFPHYKNSFDVVHARAIGVGIRDYPQFLNELAQTLRPGGVLLLADGEMQLYDDQQRPMPFKTLGEPGFSWIHKVFFASYNAMKSRGSSIDPPLMNPTWLRSIDSLTDVGWDKIYIPIGPWMYKDQREFVIAEMLRKNCRAYIAGLAPLLLSDGYLPEVVDNMLREADAELQELRVHIYSRWCFAWALKRS